MLADVVVGFLGFFDIGDFVVCGGFFFDFDLDGYVVLWFIVFWELGWFLVEGGVV